MSAGIRGRPFTYPDSLIRLLASIRLLFHLPYRQLEGFTGGLSRYVDGLKAPDYTTLEGRGYHSLLSIGFGFNRRFDCFDDFDLFVYEMKER